MQYHDTDEKENVIVTRQKMYKLMDVFYRHTKSTLIPICCSPELDQSHICPHPTSWRSSLIIPFYLHHVFSVLFSSGFPSKTLYALLLSPHACHMTCPFPYFWFDHLNNIWKGVQVMKLLTVQSPPVPCKSFSLRP